MINIANTRKRVGEVLDAGLQVDVHTDGVDASVSLPCVIIGQPSWAPAANAPYGVDRTIWPVACVVARNAADSVGVGQLDQLWPEALKLLRATTETDPTFGGVCSEALVTRAEFTPRFVIQGQTLPAQLIFLELYG